MTNRQKIESMLPLLYTLPADRQPLWGRMTAQHMVEHLALTFTLSNGKRNVPVQTPPDKIEKRLAYLRGPEPLIRGFVPDGPLGELPPLRFGNIPAAADAVKKQLLDMDQWFAQNPLSEQNHPVFGALQLDDWLIFHHKHFIHHLTQFGLIADK